MDTLKKTALVTGASSGLGEQYATLFAQDGHDVVLVARSKGRLEGLAAELTRQHKVQVYVVPVDLSDPAAPGRLFEEVAAKGLTVDFLVNNAGFGSTGPFLDQQLPRESEMLEVNAHAVLQLCHLFGRGMRERGFGRILNVASTAAFQPGPYMATYYATKAFVLSFSEALAHELKGSGVTVTCHCPGAVDTPFAQVSGNEKTRLFQWQKPPGPALVAAHGYRSMHDGEVVAVPGVGNWLGVVSAKLSPRPLTRWFAAGVNSPP